MSVEDSLRDELIEKIRELTETHAVYSWYPNIMFNLKNTVLGLIVLEFNPDRRADLEIYTGMTLVSDVQSTYFGRCTTSEDTIRYLVTLPENHPRGIFNVEATRMPAYAVLNLDRRIDYFFLPTQEFMVYLENNSRLMSGKE